MKQVKNLLFLLFIVGVTTGCKTTKTARASAEAQEIIKSDFSNYLNLIVNQEFDKSMDYIIPEFFEIIPRDIMVQAMETTFSNPDVEFEFEQPEILSIGKIMEVEDRYYSKLKYSNNMKMKFTVPEDEEEETAEDKEFRISLTKLSFEQTFGEGNVEYNEETEFFQIFAIKNVVAISDNGKSDWKFLVIEEKQKFILGKLLPKKILEME